MARESNLRRRERTLWERAGEIDWVLVAVVTAIACFGIAMLYSAGGESVDSWTGNQAIRFAACMAIMLAVAVIDLRFWMRHAYAIYGVVLGLLIAVEAMGIVGMGARRWIDLGLFQLQPSEPMKVALVLALARYFHCLTHEETGRAALLVPPLAMVAMPAALMLGQPDLGTATMLVVGAAALTFAAGVRWWKFALAGVATAAAAPVVWSQLYEYQRLRVMTFINQAGDLQGAGYQIHQAKTALASGGLFGRGFGDGTQSHLGFLPEHRTDFIFTMLGEELGFLGAGGLLLLYLLLFAYGVAIALRARSQFGRLLAVGATMTLFLYVFINVAMVTGLVPVVGVPLPLVSYGGSAMLTAMWAIGLIMSVSVHRDVAIGRNADSGANAH